MTGLDVGPDGALYFCTGGRGTDGGVYRLRWTGNVPPQAIQFGQGIQQALHQPQFQTDWARMRIAAVKKSLGDQWQSELERIIANPQAPVNDRARAVDLLAIFGPPPSPELLVKLAGDPAVEVRVRAARLMGMRNHPSFAQPLVELLGDFDPWVRRVACESIAHRGDQPPIDTLVGLLSDKDRFVAFAARRALERRPAAGVAGENSRRAGRADVSLRRNRSARRISVAATRPADPHALGSHAPRRSERSEPANRAAQQRQLPRPAARRAARPHSRAGRAAGRAQPGAATVQASIPARDASINRELVKLLAYLQPPGAAHALAAQVATNIPDVEKLQIAAYAPRITAGWETPDKLIMLRYYEQIRGIEGGHSINGYVENFARDFFATFTLAERRQVIAVGESFPTSTLSILAKLPENVGPMCWPKSATWTVGSKAKRARHSPVCASASWPCSAAAATPRRSITCAKSILKDPQRRAPVAMSLTQHPDGDNWEILVDSLRTLEGEPAKEVIAALTNVKRRPETSEPYRNTILRRPALAERRRTGRQVARTLDRPARWDQPAHTARTAARRVPGLVRRRVPQRTARRAAQGIAAQQVELRRAGQLPR